MNLILPITFLFATAPATFTIERALDVPYLADNNSRHTLDVFSPKGVKNAPVLIFVHGGGWVFGDKNMFGYHRSVGLFMASHGVVTVNVNYRLSPEVRHPEHVEDVARAYAWVRRNIANYGGDPDRIILCGHSAGGHIATLLATDERYLSNPNLGLKPEDRAALRGVITLSGVYRVPTAEESTRILADFVSHFPIPSDSTSYVALRIVAVNLIRRSNNINVFRLVFGDDPDVIRSASPLTHVHKGLPPFLVLYAEYDLPLLADMAQVFGALLRAAGVDVDLNRIDFSSHETILFRLYREKDAVSELVLKFIDKQAGPVARP